MLANLSENIMFSVLSDEEWSSVPEDLANKVKNYLKETEEEKTLLENKKNEYVAEMTVLERNLFDVEEDLMQVLAQYHGKHFYEPKGAVALAIMENNLVRLKILVKSFKEEILCNIPRRFCTRTPEQSCNILTLALLQPDLSLEMFDFLFSFEEVKRKINEFDCQKRTPLMEACKHTNSYFAVRLLTNGADVNLYNVFDGPLHYAVQNGNTFLCKALFDRGLDVKISSEVSVFHVAYNTKNNEMLHMMLYYGVDVTPTDAFDLTVFDRAVIDKNFELQESLCDYFVFEGETLRLNFSVLVVALESESPILSKLLPIIEAVVYDEFDLIAYGQRLFLLESKHFKYFLGRFKEIVQDILDLTSNIGSLLFRLNLNKETATRVMRNIRRLITSDFVSSFVDMFRRTGLKLNNFASFFVKYELQFCLLHDIFAILLTYGVDVEAAAVDVVYANFSKFNPLFKVLLHMDITQIRDASYRDFLIMPALVYNVHMNIEEFLANSETYDTSDQDPTVLDLLYRFANPKLLTLRFFRSRYSEEGLNMIKDQLPKVPSLVELARNSAREFVRERYEIKNSMQFFTVLATLPICEIHKKIISYERRVYYVELPHNSI